MRCVQHWLCSETGILKHVMSRCASNNFVKYADDTTLVEFIRDGEELAYREEMTHLVDCCHAQNLIKLTKIKEMTVDFRKNQHSCAQFGTKTQRWRWSAEPSVWGTVISGSLSIEGLAKKNGEERAHFWCRLRRMHLPSSVFATFYKGTMEVHHRRLRSLSWLESCKFSGWKSLHGVVRTEDIISGTSLPPLKEIAQQFGLTRAKRETPADLYHGQLFYINLWEEVWRPHANRTAKRLLAHPSPFTLSLHCSNSIKLLLLCTILICKINNLRLCKCLQLNCDQRNRFYLPSCCNSCRNYSLLPLDVTRPNVFIKM